MSEIGDIAVEVFKNRKAKLKVIEERKKQRDEEYKIYVERYAKHILSIFDDSNFEENSDILVWKIEVENFSEKLKCSVSFSNTGEDFWVNLTDMEQWEYPERVKRVMTAIKVVEACREPVIVKDIYELLRQNILSSYDLELLGSHKFRISIHDPSQTVNEKAICEKEESEE